MMHVFVISNEEQYNELVAKNPGNGLTITRLDELPGKERLQKEDVLIDLLFEYKEERIKQLLSLNLALIIINSVAYTLADIGYSFIRINGWNGFLGKDIIEAAFADEKPKQQSDELFAKLGKQLQWLPDTPGLVSARVISMIINEAHYALNEQLSTKEEIDTAMKLGTGYPNGPFQWAERIGIEQVKLLLNKMAESDKKYVPAIKD